MKLWRTWPSRRSQQVVNQAQVQGHIFQINSEGDVSIDATAAELIDDPGMTSISPPNDYIGRPIRGRDGLVEDVSRNVTEQRPGKPIQVLCGIGGSGKSTIAMLVASAAQRQHIDTWWINATDMSSLFSGMRQLTLKIGVSPERLARAWSGKESAIDLLWEFLEGYPRKWIIIVDGADDTSILAAADSMLRDGNGWLRPPRTSSGSIIVTSRDSNPDNWATWCSLRPVDRLSVAAGAAVLTDYADAAAGSAADAERLARRLGGLPLALRLAGTYLKGSRRTSWPGSIRSFKEYLRALEDARLAELFPELDDVTEVSTDRDARELVGRTWELSLRLLERRGVDTARSLLQQLSHFSSDPIPTDILHVEALNGFGITKNLSQKQMQRAIEAIADFGLIDIRSPEEETSQGAALVLHPVVRDVSRYGNRLLHSRTTYHSAAAVMLADTISRMGRPRPKYWPLWHILLGHSSYLLEILKNNQEAPPGAVSAAAYCGYRAAQFLVHRAEFGEAIALQRSALKSYEKLVGPNDPNILHIRHDIAVALGHTGQLREAEAELKQIYERRAALHGSDGRPTLATLHAYADILWQSGKLPSAQKTYEFILDAFSRQDDYGENALGTENNLIQVLMEQGKYGEAASRAELMLRNVNAHNFDETTVLQTRFTRARVRMAQAEFDEAIAELQEIYESHSRTLGESHPITLATRHELGVALQQSGRPDKACDVLEPTLEIRNRISGANHFETLNTQHQLALSLHESGRHREAKEHYTAALLGRGTVHGPDNHLTLATRYQLAVLLEDSGNVTGAEHEFRKVLQGERKALGYDHPSVLVTRTKLVQFDIMRGNMTGALRDLRKILEAQRSIFPPGHPSIRQTEELLAGLEAARRRL